MPRPFYNRLVFVLALLGVFLAGYLWKMHATPEDIPCGLSHGGCDDVARSPYSRFPVGSGPPVAMWGTLGYLAIAAVAFLRTLVSGAAHNRLLLLASIALSLLGTLVALRLTLYEYQMNKWCQWCVMSQCLIAALFVLNLTEYLQTRKPRHE